MNKQDLNYRTLFTGGSGSTNHNASLINKVVPNTQNEKTLNRLLNVRCLNADFSLTNAEKIVAKHFIMGKSYSDIAELRKVRRDTIKTQISSILAKTDCDSRAKLILLVLCINHQPRSIRLQPLTDSESRPS